MFNADPSSDTPADAGRLHQQLVERARRTEPDNVDAVFCLLITVLIHGFYEDTLFAAVGYAAPEMRDSLAGEHARLRETLDLMLELEESRDRGDALGDAAGADLATLCGVVHRRLLRHVERDARVIYGSLARLDAISAPKPEE